jgi:hypothetical protein
MENTELDLLATGLDPLGGPAEAWEFALAAGFAAVEARRTVLHRSGACHDEPLTENGARHASER